MNSIELHDKSLKKNIKGKDVMRLDTMSLTLEDRVIRLVI